MTKPNAVLPVPRATGRTAMAHGVDPYNSHTTMAAIYARYARMCGFVSAPTPRINLAR